MVLIGHHLLIDWVRFNAERAAAAGKDVHHRLEGNSNMRQGPADLLSLSAAGPDANAVMEKIFGAAAGDQVLPHRRGDDRGRTVRALRHGMAGQPGFEFYGPWEDSEAVLNALILEAGEEFEIVRVGAKAYSATPLESGWVPTPFPAIFDEDFAEYREWLPAARAGSIGGSLYSRGHPRLLHDSL